MAHIVTTSSSYPVFLFDMTFNFHKVIFRIFQHLLSGGDNYVIQVSFLLKKAKREVKGSF